MRPILVSTVAVALTIPSLCHADDMAGWENLLGNWKLTSLTQGERTVTGVVKTSIRIEEGVFTITSMNPENGRQVTGSVRVKIEFSKSPAQINIVDAVQFGHGKVRDYVGIIKLEDEKLIMCFEGASQERPTRFETEERSKKMLLVYVRATQ